jgi:UDP-N-acetylmuramate: L-alanyl-gamma-D-glutamyl-meso-diaminopimelate ligase
VIVAAAHLPGKVPEQERISENELVGAISEYGKDARFVPAVDEIVALLVSELREGDRVVVLSNGGFGGIHEKLLRALGASP